MINKRLLFTFLGVAWMFTIHISVSLAQELEPRSLTNLPLGTNFAVAGYQYTSGNLLFDPTAPLEDVQARLNSFVLAYARSINLFGLSAKVDAVLPYGIGNWDGLYTGIDTATFRSGFADLRARLSVNFIGAPALEMTDYANYKPDLISGISVQLFMPTGQYFEDRLINLGTNRWIVKAQWGIAKYFNSFILEFYTAAWLFTKNNSFWGGNTVTTQPLFTFKTHGIWTFNNRTWLAGSLGYGIGARGTINEDQKENRISTLRFALNYAIPLGRQHTIKFVGTSAIRFERGPDIDAISVLYQYRW
jgi:hypothetical protein